MGEIHSKRVNECPVRKNRRTNIRGCRRSSINPPSLQAAHEHTYT